MDVIGSIPVGPTTEDPVIPADTAGTAGFSAVLRARSRPPENVGPGPSVTAMEHVMVRTRPDGRPLAVMRGGREWLIGAEPVRWFERVNWWEAERRMPKGLSRVDVEVWRVQARLGRNRAAELTTMELLRDRLGGGWRLRSAAADGCTGKPGTLRTAPRRRYWGIRRWGVSNPHYRCPMGSARRK